MLRFLTLRAFLVLLVLMIAVMASGCYTFMKPYSGPSLETYHKRYQKYKKTNFDDATMMNLLQLHKRCSQAKKEEPDDSSRPEECQTDYGLKIQEMMRQYGQGKQPILLIPQFDKYSQLWKKAAPGLKSSYWRTGRHSGYFVCGSVYNLSQKPIRAIKVKAFVFDHFDKLKGVVNIQKGFSPPLKPQQPPQQICSKKYYPASSNHEVGKVRFKLIDMR